MRTCDDCRAPLRDGLRFCEECGTPVARATEPVAPPSDHLPSEVNQPVAPPVTDSGPPVATKPATPRRATLASPQAPKPKRRGRWPLVLGVAFSAMSLLGSGFLAGWLVASDRSLVLASEVPERIASQEAAATELSMPDLRGLQVSDAKQVLADIGVPAAQVKVERQPAAGETDAILAQDPVYGYGIDGPVTLTVSEEAVVPEFAGRPATEVVSELQRLGAAVETMSEFVPGTPAGAVARTEPAPGTALPQAVTVVIATAAEELPLLDAEAVEEDCWEDSGSIDDTRFVRMLYCDVYRGDASVQSYVIDRAATRVSGVFGVPNDAETNDVVRLEILNAEGGSLGVYEASYGEGQRFDLPVTGVLRLTFRITTEDRDYASAGIGRLLLTGDPDQLDTLRRW